MQLNNISKSIEKGIESRLNYLTIGETLAVFYKRVTITPVDISNAISNWQVSKNGRITQPNNIFYQGDRGSTRHLKKMTKVNLAQSMLKNKGGGDTIYIQNNAQLFKDLDEGNYEQFAGGFIPKALIIFRSELRS